MRIIGYNNDVAYIFGSAENGVSIPEVVNEWKDLRTGGIARPDKAIEKALRAISIDKKILNIGEMVLILHL